MKARTADFKPRGENLRLAISYRLLLGTVRYGAFSFKILLPYFKEKSLALTFKTSGGNFSRHHLLVASQASNSSI